IVAFREALAGLANKWAIQEEYSHGFLIPLVSAWLLWTRRDALRANLCRSAWAGPIVVLLATAINLIGRIAAIPILSQIGFVFTLAGLILSLGGYPSLRVAIFPLLFLVFAIPIPGFVEYSISSQLQLLSSQLGAFLIGMFGIPVYLDGNVID